MVRVRLLVACFVFGWMSLSLPAQQCAPAASPAASAPVAAPQAKDSEDTKKDKKEKDNDGPVNLAEMHHPTLWHDPGNIESLDLLNGIGGKEGMPKAPYTFEAEDLNGTNPKFDARDADGTKWRVKVGPEARPEVVASRILWAMGYYVNIDYNLPQADVRGIQMKRHSNEMQGDHISFARFARKPDGQKKVGIWEWKKNPFADSREFNGLRVLMAVMNSWDLKDVNNAVFYSKKQDTDYFLISDVGATFATNGLVFPIAHSKGDLDSFKKSKFIEHQTDTTVSFSTPKAPTGMLIKSFGFTAGEYARRKGFEWIGNDVPKKDARWMGDMLGRLSHQQLVDAFKAGNFPDDVVAEYTILIESRIQELKSLQ